MNPRLVQAQRCVGRRGPAGPEAEERLSRTRRSLGIVPVAANDLFGTGPVVRGE